MVEIKNLSVTYGKNEILSGVNLTVNAGEVVCVLGASGIVFMAILMASITNFRDRKIPLTLILVAAIYIGQEIFSGVTAHDNISQFGHIVGGVMGIIFGLTFTKNRS